MNELRPTPSPRSHFPFAGENLPLTQFRLQTHSQELGSVEGTDHWRQGLQSDTSF